MNNCSGNGECKNHRCSCNEGAFGADCSIIPTPLNDDYYSTLTYELFPRQWMYFSVEPMTEEDLVFQFKSEENNEIFIFHKIGQAPSRSDHDGFIKGTKPSYVIEKKENKNKEEVSIIAIHNPHKSSNATVSISQSQIKERFQSISNLITE